MANIIAGDDAPDFGGLIEARIEQRDLYEQQLQTGLNDQAKLDQIEQELHKPQDSNDPNAIPIITEIDNEKIGYQAYNDLKNTLTGKYTEQAYKNLLVKEEKVLKTINRVVNNEQHKKIVVDDIMKMSLNDILVNIVITFKDLTTFMTENKNLTLDEVIKFMKLKNRMIFIGIIVTVIALIFLIV
jgi:hypothetical protein